MKHRRLWAIALAAGCAVLAPEVSFVQSLTAEDLFDGQTLHEIRLSIHSRDLTELRERYQENIYFPADLTWRGLRVRNVAVRSRGGGSRNGQKLGLKVDIDRYTTGQRFLGLRSLVLDNQWQDKTLLRDYLAMAVYRRMGEAAPRESFARVYINNVYQGLYTIVEDVTEDFVSRTIRETGGYLYEYKWLREFYMDDPGDDLAEYARMFEPRNHEREAATTLFTPIRELFREINGPDDAVWRDRVEARIDLQEFMTHAGVQGCLASNDGILGNWGINNFYVYRFRDSNRHRLFPWDEDQAFQFADIPIDRKGPQDVVLFQRAYAHTDLKAYFLDAAERCAQRSLEDNWLVNEFERVVVMIRPSALEDPRKQFTNDEFERDVEEVRKMVTFRPAFVLQDVAQRRNMSGRLTAADICRHHLLLRDVSNFPF